MNVIHTIASIGENTGGPARSVPGLCTGLVARGINVCLITQRTDRWVGPPLAPDPKVTLTFVPCYYLKSLRVAFAPSFGTAITASLRAYGNSTVLHDHGVWMHTNHAAAAIARTRHTPFVVSPRGMLTDWSMKHKAIKKAIGWMLYQKRDLLGADVFHATSDEEADALRRLGFSQPVAIIPNGVFAPPVMPPRHDGPIRNAVFLGRINPKKGLEALVQAWARVRPHGWRLLIAGPDEDGYARRIATAIRANNTGDTIELVGPVFGARKWELLRSAELFVLPTFSENFGIVVAEALFAQVPVITTRGAPWKLLEDTSSGWWIGLGVDPLADALRDATAASTATLRAMGERGAQAAAEHYGWEAISGSMHAVYSWLLGARKRPDCIV